MDVGVVELFLWDLIGFDGWCDVIYLICEVSELFNEFDILFVWRWERFDFLDELCELVDYDFVVVGGGYVGMGLVIFVVCMGCRVVLI